MNNLFFIAIYLIVGIVMMWFLDVFFPTLLKTNTRADAFWERLFFILFYLWILTLLLLVVIAYHLVKIKNWWLTDSRFSIIIWYQRSVEWGQSLFIRKKERQ